MGIRYSLTGKPEEAELVSEIGQLNSSEVAQLNREILEAGEKGDPKPISPFDPEEIARLKKDPTVRWLDSTRYRLKDDPRWLVRRTERPPALDPNPKRPPGSPPQSKEVQEVVDTQMPGQKMGGLIAATSNSTTSV